MSDSIDIRPYRPGDETGILAGYNRIFPTADGGIKPRSMEHWMWKFRDNPTGLVHVALAEHEKEGIVGCYVTLPVKVWTEGTDGICGQVVDLYVLPEFRRHTGRPGLFVHLAWKHYEWFGGREEGKNLFHYGWPVPNWRIGQKYLKYENIRDWDFLFREMAPEKTREAASGLEVRQVERYGSDVDDLWSALRGSMGLAIARDSTYLNWRYADAHDREYRLYECRDGAGSLRGAFVYGVSDFLFPHTAFIVDWLLPADDHDATTAMVAAAERQAVRDGARVLATLFNQMDPRFLEFQRLGFMVYGTSYFLVVAPFAYETRYYREQWYITAGDSDLV